MNRPPRSSKEPLFGRRMVWTWLVQGLGLLALVAGIYALALVVFLPFLNRVFGFAPLHPWELALCLGTGGVTILINEAVKLPGLLRARRA
jgi:hypothetical protein